MLATNPYILKDFDRLLTLCTEPALLPEYCFGSLHPGKTPD
jgi:hypothetical protein